MTIFATIDHQAGAHGDEGAPGARGKTARRGRAAGERPLRRESMTISDKDKQALLGASTA
jgi:hypothetical protein